MKPIIEITGLSKKYPIVHDKAPYSTLRDTIVNFIRHPFARKRTRESFWALKDIDLTINKGDIVGIIGKNGAGKSTLLKILSGITKPTEGRVKLYGRVSSLLEVGTGFHPELTGRENIYLNGVILGMTRKEVAKKFKEIVDFAGIEKFLDTPVKHYSSGMYVRLAFAVAAHLEPDILIVDEVLAVGDSEFQKKCLGKMEEVSKEEGRTVLFVSHNMQAVSSLVNKCVLIKSGRIEMVSNDVSAVIRNYMQSSFKENAGADWKRQEKEYRNDLFSPERLFISDANGNPINGLVSQKSECFVNIIGEAEETNKRITIGYALYAEDGSLLYWSYHTDGADVNNLKKGSAHMKSRLPTELLNDGKYTIRLIGGLHNEIWLFEPDSDVPEIYFDFSRTRDVYMRDKKRPGLLDPTYKWKINEK